MPFQTKKQTKTNYSSGEWNILALLKYLYTIYNITTYMKEKKTLYKNDV
jgi:hypothetical protein